MTASRPCRPELQRQRRVQHHLAIEALYVQPLGFLPEYLPVTFKSLAVIHGPKGAGEIECRSASPST